jgi:hypothetical protein
LIRYKKTKDDSAFRDVGTHENRWSFCEEDPDYIYCEVDPEGDAFVKPDSVIATEAMVAELEAAAETTDCDGAACTVQDCVDAFEDSDAASTGLCGAGSLTTDGYGTLCSPHYLSERGNVNCVGTAVLDVDNNCGQNLTAFCKQPNGLRGTEKVWPSWGASSDGITVEELKTLKLCVRYRTPPGVTPYYITYLRADACHDWDGNWEYADYVSMQSEAGVALSSVTVGTDY